MSKSAYRRSYAVLGVFTAVAAIGLIGASNSNADASFAFTRLQGTDRYATAQDVAAKTYGTSDIVVIASGVNFPDALASSYAAGLGGVPILLTAPDSLPTPTKTALTALNATKALIIGGTTAVSAAVEKQLNDSGVDTTRIGGINRYDTAAQVAKSGGANAVGKTGGPIPPASPTAFVVSGEAFPDALAAGPAAFAAHLPVLLTPQAGLSPEAKKALTDLAIKTVLIAGGTAAVSQPVEDEIKGMGITVTRLAGTNRTETATKVADFELANLGFTKTHVDLARGDQFADALAAAPHGGKGKAPLLLTSDPSTLSPATKTWLSGHAADLKDGHILGGTAAVSQAVQDEATKAAGNTSSTTSSSSSSTSSSITLPGSSSTTSSSTTSSSTTTTTTPFDQLQQCPPGQSGPGEPFCFGTADQAGSPVFKSATFTAGNPPLSSNTITLTYSENIQCSSVAANGSDYDVQVNGSTVASTAACQGSTSNTVTLTPTGTVKGSDSIIITAQVGNGDTDNNTVLDIGNAAQPVGDKVSVNGPKMMSASATNGSDTMTVHYDQALQCSSVDSDGSDYTINVTDGPGTNSGTTPIAVAPSSATCSGSTVTLKLPSGGSFQSGQSGNVTAKNGTDGNRVLNPKGQQEASGDSKTWTVA